MKKVLVVEDDKEISNLLEIHLKDMECDVTKVFDGNTASEFIKSSSYDLIILDIMLPGKDGFTLCREIRVKENNTPILMLTSKSEEIDKVLGLELGADDYLTKPFSIRELIARIKAIFRRMESMQKTTGEKKDIIFNELKIESENRKVSINGERVELTAKEYDLLYLLASYPGRTFTRENLLNSVWGYQFNGYEHTVNSHINRLRSKIETDVSNPEYILTTWGVGYRFNDNPER